MFKNSGVYTQTALLSLLTEIGNNIGFYHWKSKNIMDLLIGENILYISETLKKTFCAFIALEKRFQIALTSFCKTSVNL